MNHNEVLITGKVIGGVIISFFGVVITTQYVTSLVVSILLILFALFFQMGKDEGLTKKHIWLILSAFFFSAGMLFEFMEYKTYIYVIVCFIILLPDEVLGFLKVVAERLKK